jgi:hypothetical protein
MKRRGLFFLFVLVSAVQYNLQAQTVYHFKYTSPRSGEDAVYYAFFSLTSNGTGIVRLKQLGSEDVTEMEILEQYAVLPDGSADTSFIVYEGMNAKVIKGNTKAIGVAHSYWFKQDAAGQYRPWAVTEKYADPLPAATNLLSADYIGPAELSKNKSLVVSYFDTASYYYKNIFNPHPVGAKGVIPWYTAKKPRMFLVVVASTKDSSLMPNCLTDARKVVDVFTDIGENELGIPVLVDSVYGSRYSKTNVEAALAKLKPGADDIVVFYYSGHGFRDQKIPAKDFPFLDLRDPNNRPRPKPQAQTLNIQDIYTSIVQKGARLNLILSDCCNDTVEAKKTKSNMPMPVTRAPMKYAKNNLIALFLTRTKMNFLMTAASKDERAIITPRYSSYFTYFFVESLRSYLSPAKGNPTWFQVMEDAKKQTTVFASKVDCPDGRKCLQTPKVFGPK